MRKELFYDNTFLRNKKKKTENHSNYILKSENSFKENKFIFNDNKNFSMISSNECNKMNATLKQRKHQTVNKFNFENNCLWGM